MNDQTTHASLVNTIKATDFTRCNIITLIKVHALLGHAPRQVSHDSGQPVRVK